MKAMLAAFLSIAAIAASAAQPSRLTEKCNTQQISSVTLTAYDPLSDRIAAVVGNPALDPDLFRRLWEPVTVRQTTLFGNRLTTLGYDPSQDVAQIAAEVAVDPALRLAGQVAAEVTGYGCFLPSGYVVRIIEYRNAILDHYFLSASDEENASIDSGAAGPGWSRTGEVFSTLGPPDACNGSHPVYRFYGPAAHSHVFTPDPQECGNVRKPGTGWLYEGIAFGAYMPFNGQCASFQRTVWRLYNNRAAQNDSNHRYVTRQSLVEEMTQRGWLLEGVAFCVNP